MTDPVDPGFSILSGVPQDHPDLTFGSPSGAVHLPPGMPPLDPGQLSRGEATVHVEPADAPVVPTFNAAQVPDEHLANPTYVEPEVPDA